MNTSVISKVFGCCSLCGKRLVRYGTNGELIYIFGDNLEGSKGPIVNMVVVGSIRMQCTRKSCRNQYPNHWSTFHWNVFDYMRFRFLDRTTQEQPEEISNPANDLQTATH